MFCTNGLSKFSKPLTGLALISLITLSDTAPVGAKQFWMVQAPAPSGPNITPLDEEYRLAPGDRIRIDNVQGREYGGEFLVPPDGNLSLPMIGTISVLGLSMAETADLLVSRYRRFFKYPQIGVSLLTPRAINITVVGEVSFPGSYSFAVQDTRFPGIQFPTVTQAISEAGGITLTADTRNIRINRRLINAPEQVIQINLWEFLQTGNSQQNITLRDGDAIIIPTADNIQIPEAQRLAVASFAPDLTTPRTVAIMGEVRRPGSYVVKGGTTELERLSEGLPTVTRALQLAGGVTATADIQRIQLRRRSTAGTQLTYNIDLWQFLQTGEITLDPIVQQGDMIVIPSGINRNSLEARQIAESNFAANLDTPRTVTVVGQVTNPGIYVVSGGDSIGSQPPFGSRPEGLPTVSRAIQLAGGITPEADIRRIQIRRSTKTGGTQIFNVDLWQLLQTGDSDQNPIVEDRDSIIIPTATDVNPAEATQVARANFSPETIEIFVVGEEARPPGVQQGGGIQVPPHTSLNQALLASGAFNRVRANTDAVELIRFQSNGTLTKRTVNIDLSAEINEQTNPLLRNNDVIIVNRSTLARITDTYDTFTNFLLFAPRTFALFQLLEILGVTDLIQ
ncbi:MAG: SLBB domain-containing protein [Planktothrix sp.]